MRQQARSTSCRQARLCAPVGAAVVLQTLAASCVPPVPMEGVPCDVDDCADGFRCCSGRCEPVDRCTDCFVDEAGLDASPGCDCDSFQPMCVGARWQYDEFDIASGELLDSKTQVVTGFADPGEPLFQKSGFNAYNVCRTSDDSLKLAWQTIDGERAASHVHRWFGPVPRKLRTTTYFVPSLLRLDQSKVTPGDAWTETNTWVALVEPGIAPDPCNDNSPPVALADLPNAYQCTGDMEQWSVISVVDAELLGLDRGSHAENDVLCHRVERGPIKISCYARGVGKLFELDVGDKREVLVSYQIPGCGASP